MDSPTEVLAQISAQLGDLPERLAASLGQDADSSPIQTVPLGAERTGVAPMSGDRPQLESFDQALTMILDRIGVLPEGQRSPQPPAREVLSSEVDQHYEKQGAKNDDFSPVQHPARDVEGSINFSPFQLPAREVETMEGYSFGPIPEQSPVEWPEALPAPRANVVTDFPNALPAPRDESGVSFPEAKSIPTGEFVHNFPNAIPVDTPRGLPEAIPVDSPQVQGGTSSQPSSGGSIGTSSGAGEGREVLGVLQRIEQNTGEILKELQRNRGNESQGASQERSSWQESGFDDTDYSGQYSGSSPSLQTRNGDGLRGAGGPRGGSEYEAEVPGAPISNPNTGGPLSLAPEDATATAMGEGSAAAAGGGLEEAAVLLAL